MKENTTWLKMMCASSDSSRNILLQFPFPSLLVVLSLLNSCPDAVVVIGMVVWLMMLLVDTTAHIVKDYTV